MADFRFDFKFNPKLRFPRVYQRLPIYFRRCCNTKRKHYEIVQGVAIAPENAYPWAPPLRIGIIIRYYSFLNRSGILKRL